MLVFSASAPRARDQEFAPFDFYVLSLSWSPSFCASEAGENNRMQCGDGGRHGFIVHGLWPQFERGYPEYCETPYPDRVSRADGEPYFDIMPGMGLIGHQWRKHGTCTGMSPAGYLEKSRSAFDRIALPAALQGLDSAFSASPDTIEEAFIVANPGLTRKGMAVSCDEDRLREVRICLTRDLAFRSCPEVDAAGCRADSVTVPPRE